jgi:predicted RNase H-like HicB family nuclease
MYRFLVIIEQGENSYGAYSPDLPGCVAVGMTREEVERNMREAIEMHIQGMIEDNEPIPVSTNQAEYMDVSAPTSAA